MECLDKLLFLLIFYLVGDWSFWVIGWGLMFGGDNGHGWFGTQGLWMLSGVDNSPATGDAYQGVYGSIEWATVPLYIKFFFQLVFGPYLTSCISVSRYICLHTRWRITTPFFLLIHSVDVYLSLSLVNFACFDWVKVCSSWFRQWKVRATNSHLLIGWL